MAQAGQRTRPLSGRERFELKAALSERYGVPADWITLGNGSNDILEIAAHAFVEKGQSIVYAQYSFAVYALATQGVGARAIVVPAVEVRSRPRRDARRDHRRHASHVRRESEQSDRHVSSRRGARSVSRQACRVTWWSCWTRRTRNICREGQALRFDRMGAPLSESAGVTDVFKGVRAGWIARGFRALRNRN